MGSIKIGKFEISQQSGTAGKTPIGHKLTEKHTGRNKYQKMVRASISAPGSQSEAIETLEVQGMTPYLTLNTSQTEVAYNITTATLNGKSNAEKFRVSSSGKAITLVTNTGYTVSQNVGTFSAGFGEQAEGTVAIKLQFAANNTSSSETIPVLVEYWDGSEWQSAGTHNIIQSSSDADVSFTITPNTLEDFAKEGGTQTVSITSNVAYSIEVQGDVETSWLTLSRQSGTATTEELNITAAAQAVGAEAREVSIKFKSNITGSVIGTLAAKQVAGEAYAISWESDTITFTNDDLNQIKNNNLTANSDWYIEEVV